MRILFVHQGLATFVKKDLEILSEEYNVRHFYFEGWKDLVALWKDVKWCDTTFSWFCSPHAFAAVLFSKILGKKSVVVAGGYDVVNAPEIKYGVYYGATPLKKIKQAVSRFTFKMVDLVLCVSQSNMEEAIKNAHVSPKNVRLIYHGFDYSKFDSIGTIKKEPIVLTVGDISSSTSFRKGHDLFVKSAAYLPDIQFVMVGNEIDDFAYCLKNNAPKNVAFWGRISDEKLLQIFRRSKVYVQTSRHEGFGCAMAEAMLFECVPVVSRRTAFPEVVGDCGFYVDELTPEAVAEKIKEALATDEDMGKRARNRIKEIFPREKRKRELIESLDTLIINN